MIKTNDGTMTKRLPGLPGDRMPTTGFKKLRALYTATGGETSINLALLTPSLSYQPGMNQIAVKRSSGGSLISGLDFTESSTTTITFAAGDALIAGEVVEISQEAMVTGIAALAARPDCYTATATTGQTLVTCDFSWPFNLNSAKAIGGVAVYLHGVLQTRGVDYTEVDLATANTNKILFVDALLGGENIVVVPTYQAIDTSAAASTFNGQALQGIQSLMSAGTQGFVDQSTDMITVPNTTIVGRAKIPNLANDLRASLGVERIMTQQIVQLQNEFGESGEPVYAALNDDRGLIRFVGTVNNTAGAYGQYIDCIGTSSFLEITFYGTGLNISTLAFSTSCDIRVSVDGGAEGSNIWPSSLANVLGGRNYSSNQIVSAVSGLTLGVHTIKMRCITGGSSLYICSFEILNANASGLININPGVSYNNGQKVTKSTSSSVAYNTGVTGTRGGRVVRYLNADGTVGQAVTAVNAAAAYLASADHTNEEVVRVYSPREFGAGRISPADDFSTLDSSVRAAAFTLDDGTTSLILSSGRLGAAITSPQEGIVVGTSSALIFTFIGTGLDILLGDGASVTRTFTVYVDGSSIGTIATLSTDKQRMVKVASGLAYGTHTVKLVQDASSPSNTVCKFAIYQPKKPTIPTTALELCDYNVMADYSSTASANASTISTGTLRKMSIREMVYSGSWQTPLIDTTENAYESGFRVFCPSGTTAYAEYTFFGIGCDAGLYFSSGPNSLTVSVDSSTNLTGKISLIQPGGLTLTPASGTVTGSATAGRGRILLTGFALGMHTVRIQWTISGPSANFGAFDIITPIHSHKSNIYADLQNTLTVGSNSLMDSRKTSMIKEALPATKAFAQAIGVTSAPTTTSATLVPMTDLLCTLRTSGGNIDISFEATVQCTLAGATLTFAIYVDGVSVSPVMTPQQPVNNYNSIVSHSVRVPVSSGAHSIAVYWSTNTGTLQADGTRRVLTVKEV